ncbi:hypothetical protein RFI_18273, partial [Reticulomyxa filosa]
MGITIKRADSVRLITDWNSSGICDKKEVHTKTKTALLLDKNHQVIAFGNEAWTKFYPFHFNQNSNLFFFFFFTSQNYSIFFFFFKKKKISRSRQRCRQIHCIYNWPFLKKNVADIYQTNEQPTIKRELKSMNGICINSEIVFVGALKFCKQKAIEYFKQNHITINENKIQWVITVPAIWSEEAKGLMKQWAQQAEIWSPSIPNQLLMYLNLNVQAYNPNTVQFKTGDCYVMMDLGAGTADIVCHEIIGPFEVREMISSFGGPWGSSYIDKDVEIIFDEIFQTKSGEKKMKEFQAVYSTHYLKLLENIENGKQRFFNNKKIIGTHRIEVPYEFDQFMRDNISKNLEEL